MFCMGWRLLKLEIWLGWIRLNILLGWILCCRRFGWIGDVVSLGRVGMKNWLY